MESESVNHKAKYEQLYVDGESVDIDVESDITLVVKSLLLGDFNSWMSNGSYSVKLPKTVRNRRILGFSDLVNSTGTYPYQYHKARYLRNGVEIVRDGRLVVMESDDEAFYATLLWGFYPAFEELKKSGMMINQLESDARLRNDKRNQVSTYADAVGSDYFYALMDCRRYELDESTDWVSGSKIVSGESSMWDVEGSAFYPMILASIEEIMAVPLHPSAKVSWLLRLIREEMGVEFRWSGEAKDYIDSLIIPVIGNKADKLSYDGAFSAKMEPMNMLGYVKILVNSELSAITQYVGQSVTSLTMAADANLVFNVEAKFSFEVSMSFHFMGMYFSKLAYLVMSVKRGEQIAEYVIGSKEQVVIEAGQVIDNVATCSISGKGGVSLLKGDIVTFELRCDEDLYRFKLLDGDVVATIGETDAVPVGGYWPIVSNLPKIKIYDLIRFLCCVTGTFPKNRCKDGVLEFVSLSDLWGNVSKAVDWTRRVIAPSRENTPQYMSFNGDFAQHNRYKWKVDDTVYGNYDGDLVVHNEWLESEKDVIEFPFAPSDGSNIPLYTGYNIPSENDEGSDEDEPVSDVDDLNKPKEEPKYSSCEPRIMRLKSYEGSAAAHFDISMQSALSEKYGYLIKSLNAMKVIRETIRIRDIELKDFDESIPVYLSQYGCYFAVLEMKAQGGFAEVTMMRMVID